jgi:hypothetical protein
MRSARAAPPLLHAPPRSGIVARSVVRRSVVVMLAPAWSSTASLAPEAEPPLRRT